LTYPPRAAVSTKALSITFTMLLLPFFVQISIGSGLRINSGHSVFNARPFTDTFIKRIDGLESNQQPSGSPLLEEDEVLQLLMWNKPFNKNLEMQKTFEKENVRGPSHYEFGWEVGVMVPHAYASVMDGSVNITRSCGDLSALYWFSPHHENLPCLRNQAMFKRWHGITRQMYMSNMSDSEIPKWLPPPHKDHYSKMPVLPNLFQPNAKRSIMVVNKFAIEWGHQPINFFSKEMLDWMSTSIRDKCPGTQMVYQRNRLLNKDPSAWSTELDSLGDFELLRGHEHVVNMEDVIHKSTTSLIKTHNLSFNEIQMRAMSKHQCFASVQGGFMTLVAQFGAIGAQGLTLFMR
jgi:hypothetical protein